MFQPHTEWKIMCNLSLDENYRASEWLLITVVFFFYMHCVNSVFFQFDFFFCFGHKNRMHPGASAATVKIPLSLQNCLWQRPPFGYLLVSMQFTSGIASAWLLIRLIFVLHFYLSCFPSRPLSLSRSVESFLFSLLLSFGDCVTKSHSH